MKYSIKKNWNASFEMIMRNPVLLIPFIFVSFFELLAMEFICFSTRPPLSVITAPIIRKFFGETFLHYPANFMAAPKLFYCAQIVIYVLVGVLFMAISVNIFNNIKEKLPVVANAVARNALKRYWEFLVYGILLMALIAAIQPLDKFVFTKAFHLAQRMMPRIPAQLGYIGLTIFLFLTNFFVQVVFIASVPFMVLEKKPLFKAIGSSVVLFAKNISTMVVLIGLPFLIYAPIVALKSLAGALTDVTSPEIIVVIIAVGSIVSIFIDCFTIVCASRLITDIAKSRGKTT